MSDRILLVIIGRYYLSWERHLKWRKSIIPWICRLNNGGAHLYWLKFRLTRERKAKK